MEKIEDIRIAITETLKSHPDWASVIHGVILTNISMGINEREFTRTNGARDRIKDKNPSDFIEYLLSEGTKIYGAISSLNNNINTQDFPLISPIINMSNIINDDKINSIEYYMANPSLLSELCIAVCQTFYKNNWYLDRNIRGQSTFYNEVSRLASLTKEYDELKSKLEKDIKEHDGIKDVTMNLEAITECRKEIMSGAQLKYQHRDYHLGDDLHASIDIGNIRKNQEDSVLIDKHHTNPEIKIAAIADGMGGHDFGEVASTYTTEELGSWFQKLPDKILSSPTLLQEELNKKIKEISDEIYDNLLKNGEVAGCTLVVAVTLKDNTIISSVGDSRGYIIDKNGKIDNVTEDESKAWDMLEMYKRGKLKVEDLDTLRYFARNNVIKKCLGERDISVTNSYIIPNDYQKLLLFSDGVTDLLDSKTIRVIANSKAPSEIAPALIDKAMNTSVKGYDPITGEPVNHAAGKDNASVAVISRGR